jgi:hypothetical protein
MSADPPQLNPSALSVDQVAQVLSAAGGRPVTIAMVESDLVAGAPRNANGTINLVMYAAWLLKDRGRGD